MPAETSHVHPHARGEDEHFQLLYVYDLNVDEARRLIASGEIVATAYEMPVRAGAERLLGMDPAEFGSAPPGGPYPPERATSLFANVVDRGALASIPTERMAEAALMVMWDSNKSTRLTSPRAKPDPSLQPSPFLVDGSHRLARRFLEGDEGTMPTLVVREWDDVCRFLSVRGRKVAPPKAPGTRRTKDAATDEAPSPPPGPR